MTTREITFTLTAPVPPEAVLDALTDFSPARPRRWPALEPAYYEVHDTGDTSALVREGQRNPRLWALEAYDWSIPGTVTWTAKDSNFCTPGSYMSARPEPDGAGGSLVHFRWNRSGTGVKGRMLITLLRMTDCRPLAANLAKSLAYLGDAAAGPAPDREQYGR